MQRLCVANSKDVQTINVLVVGHMCTVLAALLFLVLQTNALTNSPVCGSGLTAFEGPANQRLFDCSMTTQSGPRQRPLTAAAQAV